MMYNIYEILTDILLVLRLLAIGFFLFIGAYGYLHDLLYLSIASVILMIAEPITSYMRDRKANVKNLPRW